MQNALGRTLASRGAEALRLARHASCVACGAELPWRARTASCCEPCWQSLPRIATTKCRSCAIPLLGAEEDAICLACTGDPLPLDWCDAWGEYRGPLERVLHALKFARHDFFAAPLAELLCETLRDREFDVVVPVPMTRAKERRRGYNQAELLARELAKRIGVPCELLLEKEVDRAAQSTLAKGARRANVRNAFAASDAAAGRRILIVDDVCTTGETLRACAAAIARVKPARLCAIVVAKAV